jgi:hypothetical protein
VAVGDAASCRTAKLRPVRVVGVTGKEGKSQAGRHDDDQD